MRTLVRENAVPALKIGCGKDLQAVAVMQTEEVKKRHCRSRLRVLSKTTVRGT